MFHPNPILAVLFDLDGTLRHNQPNSFETFIEYLGELGYTLNQAQLQHGERWSHYYWSISPNLKADLEEFGGQNSAFWTRHAERQLRVMKVDGDIPALARQINQLFEERYLPSNYIPDDVMPTLTRLRAAGYTLGLVSNRTEPLDAVVAEIGLEKIFNFTLSAGQAQSWKPDPKIFRRAAALAQCLPEAVVYVGDNFYADVEGARGVGMHPVLVDPKRIFPEPGCPVIRALSELETALEYLGTNAESPASVS
ncbi:MAG: HAD family hydrolase [Anaerolineales bacterium]